MKKYVKATSFKRVQIMLLNMNHYFGEMEIDFIDTHLKAKRIMQARVVSPFIVL